MNIEFEGKLWYWRGPAPFYFITVPEAESQDIKMIANSVTYGWGMIPVRARIGGTQWTTAMFPKDGAYVLPIKLAVRKAEKLSEGEFAAVRLEIG